MRRVPLAKEGAAIFQAKRFQHGASAGALKRNGPVVSVHSKGYGPSDDILKNVPLNSQRLSLLTNLHPEDAEIQRRVLALNMPTLTDVLVKKDSGVSLDTTDQPSPLDNRAVGDRISALESAMEDQLSSLGNVIVERIKESNTANLSAQAELQNENTTVLSQLVIESLRSELRATLSATGGKDMNWGKFAADVSKRLSKELLEGMKTSSKKTIDSVGSMEKRVEKHFAKLSEKLTAAAKSGVDLPKGFLEGITDTIERSVRIEEESIKSTIEAALNNGGSSQGLNTNQFEEFVEGAVRASTDEIRQYVSGEMKKLVKQLPKGGSTDDNALENVMNKLDAVWELSDSIQTTFTEHGEKVDSLLSAQKQLSKSMEELKKTLKSIESSSQPGKPSSTGASLESIQAEFARLRGVVELTGDRSEENLASSVSMLSECIANVMEQKSDGAIQQALRSIEEISARGDTTLLRAEAEIKRTIEETVSTHLREISQNIGNLEAKISSTTQDNLLVFSQQIEKAMIDAIKNHQVGVDTPLDTKALREEIVKSVQEEMRKPHDVNLSPMYEYIDGTLSFIKEQYAKQDTLLQEKIDRLASTIMSKAPGGPTPFTEETLKTALRGEVKAIMEGVSSNSNLDTFLRERQDASVEVLARIEKKLETMEGPPKLDELLDQMSRMEEDVKGISAVQDTLSDMERSAARRNDEIISLLSASESTDEYIKTQLSVLKEDLKNVNSTRNITANSRLEELYQLTESRLRQFEGTNIQEALSAITTSLEKQNVVLRSVEDMKLSHPSAMSSGGRSSWVALRRESSESVSKITRLIREIERAPPENRNKLLLQLSISVEQLEAIQKKESLLSTTDKGETEPAASKFDNVLGELRKVETGVTQGVTKAFEELETLLKDIKTTQQLHTREAAEIKKSIDSREVSLKEHFSTTLQESLNTVRSAIEDVILRKKSQLPLWWIALNASVIVASVLGCAYYIIACFLVAFVPPPQGSSDPAVEPASDNSANGNRLRRTHFIDKLL
ncbi:hypothetical protein ADEAN_000718300 [Angomonas deanei]|uniref:Uncharacterized protein n=1 Tax=Angomonas deanei TaxID=59799 RepID=A0A7G2CL80_9TRYP|nr:hypothetical protein ADEAN_000718300 [Angomonas deanei]